MPEIKGISYFTSAPSISASTLLLVSVPDPQEESGYSTFKCSASELAEALLGDLSYTQDLDTVDKTIFGAINENARAYSNTERAIGTWIDGSTIYEKTFTIQNQSFTYKETKQYTISDYVSNVANLIDAEICGVIDNVTSILPSWSFTNQDEMLGFFTNINPMNLLVARRSNVGAPSLSMDIIVTMRYTKSSS